MWHGADILTSKHKGHVLQKLRMPSICNGMYDTDISCVHEFYQERKCVLLVLHFLKRRSRYYLTTISTGGGQSPKYDWLTTYIDRYIGSYPTPPPTSVWWFEFHLVVLKCLNGIPILPVKWDLFFFHLDYVFQKKKCIISTMASSLACLLHKNHSMCWFFHTCV